MAVRVRSAVFQLARVILLLIGMAAGTFASFGQEIADALARAQAMTEAGNFAEAELLLEDARSERPSDKQILLLLAKVEGRLGHSAKASAIFRQLIHDAPGEADLRVDLAIALADQGDCRAALAEADTAISLQPLLIAAHFTRARLLADLDRLPESDAEYSLVEKREPRNSESLLLHSMLARQMSNLPKESALLQKLVILQPRNAYAEYLLGRSLTDQGKRDQAIAAFRSSIISDPRSKEAIYSLARALRTTDPAESERLMQSFQSLRAQEASLEEVKTLANAGTRAADESNYDEAVRGYTQALARCGDCEAEAAIRRDLGLALCHIGKLDEGAEQLHIALKLNPGDSDAAHALKIINR